MSRIGGTAYIKTDSTQYVLGGEMSVSPYGFIREGKTGLSGGAGYTETPKLPYIEGVFYATEELSTEDLQNLKNATVTAELANGRTYILSQAWYAGELKINAAEGTLPFKFESKLPGKEI